jgi:hypothetical protein
MPPDDLPIPGADDTSGLASGGKRPGGGKPGGAPTRPSQGPESEVRGGSERADDPPLEQLRRDER